ncbi:hypothetical protein ACQZ4Q_16245 [Agrobacterium vitis]|uniref:hypothetical protein n=1 Tax=Agrobacterium vitis TaxID=373 RepID=UPI0015D8764C|nr:hypothetical protein [Agrobacterium vitis]BCH57609.1 hypothetical protein RvVAR0630_02330 [Agrobacterium vitis]
MSELAVIYHDIFAADYSVTGIRQDGGDSRPVIITGSYQQATSKQPQALLYSGPLYPTDSSGYHYFQPAFSGQTVTSAVFYGPTTPLFDPGIGKGNVRVVGSYKYSEGGKGDHGMIYQGPIDGSGVWTALDLPADLAGGTVANVIAHSTMGDLVVGNYDLEKQPGSANAFIYHIKTKTYTLLDLGPLTTAYGVWQNRDDGSYTIVGGSKADGGLNKGLVFSYDAATGTISHVTTFSGNNDPGLITHFEGITELGEGYSLAAETDKGAAVAIISRKADGSYGEATWIAIANPAADGICTGNSILENNLIGIYQPSSGGIQSYVASVTGGSAASA